MLERLDIFMAGVDLEHDLHDALGEVTSDFFGTTDDAEVIRQMQKRKATSMFAFLREHSDALARLKDHPLVEPLLRCQEIMEARL